MIKNYVLVAFRNLTRQKFFSAINIFGLAVSMSLCMAIMMLVADQMMYDRYNTKRSRVFRVNTYAVGNDGVPRNSVENSTSPMPLRDEIMTGFTGVKKSVRLKRGFGNGWLELENQNVNIPLKGYFADPEVFEVFEYEFEYGDRNTALTAPYSVVLTRKAADKLFKEKNPIGQSIKVGKVGTYTVTGVLKETENKSHIVFEALASMSSVASLETQGTVEKDLENWGDFWNGWTYVLMEEGKQPSTLMPHFEKIFKTHIASNPNPESYKAKFHLQSLMDITPGPLINNPIGPSLPWVFVYFLGGLAAIVMLTSCFNFTNLSIARSLKRAKEIGVRKVTGAARWQIFLQFLSESIVVAMCALVLAFVLLIILKPLMLKLTFAKLFMWDLKANVVVYAVFLVFTIVVGILAGLFPAIVLSGFQPVKVLKNLSTVKLFSKIGLRKALLVSQFTLSLIFILSVIVMYNQLELFLHKDYGFNMKNNLVVRLNNTSADALKAELQKYPNVESVAAASHVPASGTSYGDGFKKSLDEKEWTNLSYFITDEDYLKNIKVKLLAGKTFSSADGELAKKEIVINEEAVAKFNFKTAHDAIGEEIIFRQDSSKKVIIGVVKNYNHEALMSKIEPMALMYDPSRVSFLQVRYTGTFDNAVTTVEKAWGAVNPGLKVDYKDMEAEIKYFYNTIFGDIVNIMSVIAFLAIMISCLGLLGMATYTIETRMKEISIRKVLGCSDQSIVLLLSKGFLKMLIIAILIGVPSAYLINNFWLEFMAYHTQLGIGTMAIGISILFGLGLLTIGSQTLRAAFTKPVDTLKSE
jgi:putative ABC transport system permease protein